MARPICGTCYWADIKITKEQKERVFCNVNPPTGKYYPEVFISHPCCHLYVNKKEKPFND